MFIGVVGPCNPDPCSVIQCYVTPLVYGKRKSFMCIKHYSKQEKNCIALGIVCICIIFKEMLVFCCFFSSQTRKMVALSTVIVPTIRRKRLQKSLTITCQLLLQRFSFQLFLNAVQEKRANPTSVISNTCLKG